MDKNLANQSSNRSQLHCWFKRQPLCVASHIGLKDSCFGLVFMPRSSTWLANGFGLSKADCAQFTTPKHIPAFRTAHLP